MRTFEKFENDISLTYVSINEIANQKSFLFCIYIYFQVDVKLQFSYD